MYSQSDCLSGHSFIQQYLLVASIFVLLPSLSNLPLVCCYSIWKSSSPFVQLLSRYTLVQASELQRVQQPPSKAALVLSIPRRSPPDETQETLRTSMFPSTHVKVASFLCRHLLCALPGGL